uniref:Uncharacterized protein n=1 Tax=Siphoviridae sp. ctkJH11 TaxID=2825641 RepID=A0A8S5PQS3_9CAUD|nr:MAG TPA: hypothetical protein [Siphoviridae sp. ctkJH11]
MFSSFICVDFSLSFFYTVIAGATASSITKGDF